jgi:hypothetical protein
VTDIAVPWRDPKRPLNHRAYLYVDQLRDVSPLQKLILFKMAVEMGHDGVDRTPFSDWVRFTCARKNEVENAIAALVQRGILAAGRLHDDPDETLGRVIAPAWLQLGEKNPWNSGGRPRGQ